MIIYCWHCGKKFEKVSNKDGKEEFFENCPYCQKGFADLSVQSQKAVLNTLKTYNNNVFWIQDNEFIDWKPKRTPALGWNDVTLLEALTDSAKVLIGMNHIPKALEKIHKILQILRNIIQKTKRDNHTLFPRCEYRETIRTRCNRSPATLINGIYLCKAHQHPKIVR